MNDKPLGLTGVHLPEIGMGTWDYHGGIEPLHAGFELGALFVDTAESYGTESVVGQAVAGRREKVFLATKVSPENFRYNDLLKAADASLQRMGVSHIDLYQLHAPNRSVPIAETLGAMEKLVDAGKVRFIGVSNFFVKELKTALGVPCKYPIVANQVRYNLVDRTIEQDLLTYCQTKRISIIAYSPLGRELQRIRDCDSKGILNEIALETKKTTVQVLLNWCLCKDGVVVIPKGNSACHVIENCGASGWALTSAQLRRLNEGVQFRQRSRTELAIRRLLPRLVGPSLKKCLQRLPPNLRRRVG